MHTPKYLVVFHANADGLEPFVYIVLQIIYTKFMQVSHWRCDNSVKIPAVQIVVKVESIEGLGTCTNIKWSPMKRFYVCGSRACILLSIKKRYGEEFVLSVWIALVSVNTCRNTEKASRPAFAEIVQTLSSPVPDLLNWTEEDKRVHPQAVVLGAPLEAGKDLYPELQETYIHY